ncbi:TetR family transcriptional regulator [Pontibacillus yanchengensis]|uniref:TetR family transcriptional regulator n=2 Tax=Pontibacillus yanchengensis TaxID=462910 RepID=A0ACC7VD01_9BACI|nr:TetR/AcrR family transcriptional regulator [Pontibacillus yanchengensis]MYL35083.1 TetR family transcriptional regulator [Pontibacillus yanchengensis]MYL52550.1 TetR family transcriptional regulator [Pontibacillus yanchengensis]
MSPKVSKQHKEQRRANILEAAKNVFIEHGYEKATMKHILETANVSRGGLYQYFKNKEDVYEALLEDSINESMHHTLDKLDDEVSSYWDLLLARIFGEGKQPDDKMDPMAPSNLEFFITGRNDQRRIEYGKTRYYTGLKIYKSIIDQGQENGEFSNRFDSDILARSIISFIDGLALDHAILPPEDVKLKEQSIMFVDYLKMALGVDQG